MSAEAFLLDERRASRVKEACLKILSGLVDRCVFKECFRRGSSGRCCDAVIKLGDALIFLEVTGLLRLSDDVEKLERTFEDRGSVDPSLTELRRAFFVIHRGRASTVDVKRLRSMRVHGRPVFLMSCSQRLIDLLPVDELL